MIDFFSRNVDLQSFNTLAVQAHADYFVSVTDEKELQSALAQAHRQQLTVRILGGGSNVVLRDEVPGLIIHMAMRGHVLQDEDEQAVYVTVAAGENWDEWVRRSLQLGYFGLENLSLIPGTVGAAPVQNIGAYGVEVGEFIASVRLFDIASGTPQTLTAAECHFGYRDSIFKQSLSGKVVITSVTFRLLRKPRCRFEYPALQQELTSSEREVTPFLISEAVRRIRRSKLPDPATVPNVGSFFKNPVVSPAHAARLSERFPQMPCYPVKGGLIKIPAGWLIDRAGWKGRVKGAVAVHGAQALVLTNTGRGTGKEILALAEDITRDIQALYDIALEIEPVIFP